MTEKKALTLKEFIRGEVERDGIDRFKNKFSVTESTVNHWARGACLPRPEQMVRINRMSAGRVTYAEMIETFVKKLRSKN